MKLHSLNGIFERKILRIPDYQRGYAWHKHQIIDFWEDLVQLDDKRIHYTGVITLEPVKEEIWSKWDQDKWLIDGLEFKPFYVVDGQQRLTTAVILIQAILETMGSEEQLCFQSHEQIRSRYVLYKAEDGSRESFLFGYEKDNPSDEFLKTQIFNIHSHSDQNQQTLYTQNLIFAKNYFKSQLKVMNKDEITRIFKKLTQKLKFNLYEITDEIDVFVTFETMNNRGKSLTSLELLKNRLIYLSTLFENHLGRDALRTNINNAWKTIYEYLGKNPNIPLSDDLFLRNHWTMYFKYSRKKGNDYINFLLDEKFTARNITHPDTEEEQLTVEEIEDYITSLQISIKHWFYIHNSYYPLPYYTNQTNKDLLNKLTRLSFRAFLPLLLATHCSNQDVSEINKLLVAMERYNFILFSLSRRRSNTGDTKFFTNARELLNGETTIEEIVNNINNWVEKYFDPNAFITYISDKYKLWEKGFYDWDSLKYLLFEHELWLQCEGKQSKEKLSWEVIARNSKDHVTIEHIYPQTATDKYWVDIYLSFNDEQKDYLAQSLGNLLPLSRAKNSSLQNDKFSLKKNNGSGVGYYNGSASENEISLQTEWDATNILERGLKLLGFMEERWDIDLGDTKYKQKILHLEFVPPLQK